jgi:GTPase
VASPDQVEAGEAWVGSLNPAGVVQVSALQGEGVPELLEALEGHLPVSPFFYPPDEVATLPVRFFVGELVRETVFEHFREEVPYSTFCEVEEFREGGSRTYIQVNIYVERASQKGIIIGNQGAAIRDLGRDARRKIEHFLDESVYLDLWVKVLPRWRKKRGELRRLGLPVPKSHASKP